MARLVPLVAADGATAGRTVAMGGHPAPSPGAEIGSRPVRRALVLNATYEPLSVVPARRAVCLVLAEKADVLHDDEGLVRSAHIVLRTPLVIRLRYMVK